MNTAISVLLADDHTLFRQGLKRLIDDETDMAVIAEANDGSEAVRLAEQFVPHVAVLDISMPLLDGIDAGTRILSVLPDTRVLLLSAYASPDYVRRALQAGITGYLLKQVDMSTLTSSIRLLLRGELVVDAAPTAQLLNFLMGNTRPDQGDGAKESLHPREFEVLRLVAQGHSNKEVSAELRIGERTVDSHMLSIFQKLNVRSRTAAVLYAIRRGWVELDELP